MTKNFQCQVSETLFYPLDVVWEVLTKPCLLNIHNCVQCDRISDTEWVEHTGDHVDNHCKAVIDASSRRVEITSANSKYATESDTIVLTAAAASDETTTVRIDYTVSTAAVFNMISFKFFGNKIMNFSSCTIFKHIEKQCKKAM